MKKNAYSSLGAQFSRTMPTCMLNSTVHLLDHRVVLGKNAADETRLLAALHHVGSTIVVLLKARDLMRFHEVRASGKLRKSGNHSSSTHTRAQQVCMHYSGTRAK